MILAKLERVSVSAIASPIFDIDISQIFGIATTTISFTPQLLQYTERHLINVKNYTYYCFCFISEYTYR